MSVLAELVAAAAKEAGGLRSLSRKTGLCPGYLCRLKNGEKLNPSDETLASLGITRAVTYTAALSAPSEQVAARVAVSEGWRLVPIEPTEEMCAAIEYGAASELCETRKADRMNFLRKAIAAAPVAPERDG